jgi:thiol-disulfide isomerase/thioredoxin
MNKPVLASLAFVGIVIISVAFLFANKAESPATSSSPTPSTQSDDTLPSTEASGQYVDYTDEALVNADGQRVLFFHAPWCPQCRAIESDINSNGVPSGFTILKVDYDTNQELRKKYGVTLQTTFVKVDKEGNPTADKYVAYNEPTLQAITRDYLNQ